MENVLEVKNLTKKFGSFVAVDNISFSLKEGEILGVLGRNGAGKTTTIQLLLGVLTSSSGEIEYFGKEFIKYREEILEQVNFSSTYTQLPWNLRVWENLTFISYLYNIPNRKERVNKIIELFQLEELKNKKIFQLSAGQITKVNLAKSFINFPKVLLLDEPTASLDPETAVYIRNFLLKEKKKFNVSIILTSHNMSEVEEVCDRIIFIDKGEIIANNTPETLIKTVQTSHINLYFKNDIEKAVKFTEKHEYIFKVEGKNILIDIKERHIPDFLQKLLQEKIIYDEISIEKPTLEDYFLQVSKNNT